MKSYDIVIVGGGPAGIAAAASAKENGIDSILILERDKELGGILNQCFCHLPILTILHHFLIRLYFHLATEDLISSSSSQYSYKNHNLLYC